MEAPVRYALPRRRRLNRHLPGHFPLPLSLQEASMYDVHKKIGLFDPTPPLSAKYSIILIDKTLHFYFVAARVFPLHLGFNSHGQNFRLRIFPRIFPKVQFDFFIVIF